MFHVSVKSTANSYLASFLSTSFQEHILAEARIDLNFDRSLRGNISIVRIRLSVVHALYGRHGRQAFHAQF